MTTGFLAVAALQRVGGAPAIIVTHRIGTVHAVLAALVLSTAERG